MKKTDVQPPKHGPRLIGYARVSTSDQQLDMQTAALANAGVHPDNIWAEHISGVAKERAELEKALMDARRGDTFIVWKLDRMGRSLVDLLEKLRHLENKGVQFRSLTEGIDTSTPGGRLILHVMGSLAQFERDLVVERTKAGMAAHRARGGKIGQPLKMTPEKVDEARKMLERGKSVDDVATHFKVARQTIYTRFPRTVISALRAERAAKRKKPLAAAHNGSATKTS